MLAGGYLQVDETPVRVLDPEMEGKPAPHGVPESLSDPSGFALPQPGVACAGDDLQLVG